MPRKGITASLLAALLCLPLPALAQNAAFEQGTNYDRLPIPVGTRDTEKVEVVEVFSYGCIHCKNMQPHIDAWQKDLPEHVDFHRMPANFGQDPWKALAQLYYTVEALGVTEQVHWPIFQAVHERGVNLADPDVMVELVEREAGVEPDTFRDAYNSFGVRSKVQQAQARGGVYRIEGTPTFIVDGMYRVSGEMAGGNEKILDVVDHLVAQRMAAKSGGPGTAESEPAGSGDGGAR